MLCKYYVWGSYYSDEKCTMITYIFSSSDDYAAVYISTFKWKSCKFGLCVSSTTATGMNAEKYCKPSTWIAPGEASHGCLDTPDQRSQTRASIHCAVRLFLVRSTILVVNTIASLWLYTSASGALSVLSLIRAEIYISYNAKTKTHTKDNIAIRMLKHPHSKDIKRSKEPMLENRKSSFDILIQSVYLTSQQFIIPYSQNKLDLFETMLEFVCVCSWRRTMKHIWNVTVWCVSEPGNTRIDIGKIFWFRPC